MANQIAGFAALADPTRRRIFERLAMRRMAVGELASGFHVTRPAVSQHLKVLKDAGLVTAHQRGASRIYEIDPRGVAAMRDYLDWFWERALTSFKHAVEKEGRR
jgi:DNA-binding transcriptional ArsR family regulator